MEYSYHNVFLPDDPIDLCKYIGDENIFKLVFKDVSFDHKYKSPLRENDSSPGCFFWETPDSRIMFVDYGNLGKTHFTSIEFIKEYFKLKSIHEALVFIKDKFKNIVVTNDSVLNTSENKEQSVKVEKIIETFPREWTYNDKLFWEPCGITKQQLIEDNVIPVKYYKIIYDLNNFQVIIPKYETYAYNFADGKVKFYTPKDKVYKWYTNATNNTIGNIENISKKEDTLIITKSYKDCRVLRNLDYNEIVYFQNEGQIPRVDLLLGLIKNYDKIIIFYDNDEPGRFQAERLKNFINSLLNSEKAVTVHIPLEYEQKDPSDFRKSFGQNTTKQTIKKIIKNVTKKN